MGGFFMVKGVPGTENIYLKKNGYYIVSKHLSNGDGFVGSFKTLIQALMARDWAMVNDWRHYPKKTTFTNEKYISYSGSSYVVSKKIKGKTRYYGGFKSLSEAIKHRDYCMKKGWSSNCRYVNEDRNIRRRGEVYEVYYTLNGVCTYYGGYRSLEHAREIRDLCEKYDGDWDLMVEGFEFDEVEWDTSKFTGRNFCKPNKNPCNDFFIAKNEGLKKKRIWLLTI